MQAAVSDSAFLVVLGIAQDAGYPAAGCHKACCARARADTSLRRHVSCLGLVDPLGSQRWLLDCTPDFPAQLQVLDLLAPAALPPGLTGIYLTHAHIGHYTGLIHLGREALDADHVPVYAMPRMRSFLANNEPWRGLGQAGNIVLRELADAQAVRLNERLSVKPLVVPHRDEYSETVGFIIDGPRRAVLYLPDIDKWERWDSSIEDLVAGVDLAYLDGTFYSQAELVERDLDEIPHPFIVESLERFAALELSARAKIRFLHFNHTNPVLAPDSPAAQALRTAGCQCAGEGERFEL